MMFIYTHFKPGSFRPTYCDTDSMAMTLSESKFPDTDDPEEFHRGLFDGLIRDDKRESWESQWKDWFVTTSCVEDLRKPGKLKGLTISYLSCYTKIVLLHDTVDKFWAKQRHHDQKIKQ